MGGKTLKSKKVLLISDLHILYYSTPNKAAVYESVMIVYGEVIVARVRITI